LGSNPLRRSTAYHDLFRIFASQEQAERAKLLRQWSGPLNDVKIEVALALDPALVHQRAFQAVESMEMLEHLHAVLRLIRATVSSATEEALRLSLSHLESKAGLTGWATGWLRSMDRPLAAPPIQDDPDLVALYGSELEHAAREELRNCLGQRLAHAATGGLLLACNHPTRCCR
jgi:hypothetical protein